MTHVRWILVHEDAIPDAAVAALRSRWRASRDVSLAAVFGRDDVYVVHREPGNDWYGYLSRPRQDGRTFLGTPLRALLEPAGTIVATIAPNLRARGRVPVHLAVRNDGGEVWPVAIPPGAREPLVVGVDMRWEGATSPATRIELPYDVSPGATVHIDTDVVAPDSPGTYVVRWRLTQDGGTAFPSASAAEQAVTVAHP